MKAEKWMKRAVSTLVDEVVGSVEKCASRYICSRASDITFICKSAEHDKFEGYRCCLFFL